MIPVLPVTQDNNICRLLLHLSTSHISLRAEGGSHDKKIGNYTDYCFYNARWVKRNSNRYGGYETAVNEGNVFVRKQMYQEALDAYESAIRLKPDAF